MLFRSDRVEHWRFGMGTVRELPGGNRAVVDFDAAGRKTLDLELARLKFVLPELERERIEQDAALQQETFAQEGVEKEHFPGSHWSALGVEVETVLRNLPDLLAQAHLLNPLGVVAKHVLSDIEPKGLSLIWPDERRGVVVPLAIGEEQHEVMGVFPWVGDGIQHEVFLQKVHVWSSGLEGQVSGMLGDMSVDFFDVGYAMCRGVYRTGRTYQFALAGLAYSCEVVKEPEPVFITAPEAVAATRRAFGQDENDTSPIRIETKGMAALVGITKYDRDEYEFHGPVKEVASCEFLGQKLWRLRVTVLRSLEDDSERDLAVFVNERHFAQGGPPTLGDDVRGVLWLHGLLMWEGGRP